MYIRISETCKCSRLRFSCTRPGSELHFHMGIALLRYVHSGPAPYALTNWPNIQYNRCLGSIGLGLDRSTTQVKSYISYISLYIIYIIHISYISYIYHIYIIYIRPGKTHPLRPWKCINSQPDRPGKSINSQPVRPWKCTNSQPDRPGKSERSQEAKKPKKQNKQRRKEDRGMI